MKVILVLYNECNKLFIVYWIFFENSKLSEVSQAYFKINCARAHGSVQYATFNIECLCDVEILGDNIQDIYAKGIIYYCM